ncbi:MAG: flavodoxin family protein [Planctomycetota bacterium]
MARVWILYYSRTGNTEAMARAVEEGVRKAGGTPVCKPVTDAHASELLEADALILGTPTYYGLPAGPLKTFLDETSAVHGKLEGKVGGAFSTSVHRGGGNETAILALLQAMLVHGMVVPGAARGDHYGPVALGEPDAAALTQCRELGERITRLAERLAG